MLGYAWSPGTSQGDGNQLTGTTPTSILPGDTAKWVVPAQSIWGKGVKFKVSAFGKLSSAASTPGNLTFDVRFGSVIVATTQAIALATSLANNTWLVDWELLVRSIGNSTSATIMHAAKVYGVTATAGFVQAPATSPAAGTGFDSTTSQAVDFFATFSSASGSNLITCNGFEIAVMN